MVKLLCDNPKCICEPCSCDDCRCAGPKLGDLERLVMTFVWDHEGSEVTGRLVADGLPGYAYTTLATVLDRLSKKGYLRKRTERGIVRFSAADSEGEHAAAAMRDILEKTNDSSAALVKFAQAVSRSEATLLQKELRRRDQSATRKRKT
jgi:predicted transcriptional regulator